MFGDSATVNEILKCETAFDAKNLLCMLKATAPKLLIEASSDRLWGTGVDLWDHQCLNQDKWYSTGWMSVMLADIWDKN